MADVETIFRFSWRPSKLNNIHNYSFVCKYKKIRHPANQRRKDDSRGLLTNKSFIDSSVAGPETNGTTPHVEKNNKTSSPWSPQSAGSQRLQFYRWVWSPYLAQSITIITIRRLNFYRWNKKNLSFIYHYSMCIGSARPETKGEFLKWWLVLFSSPLRRNDAYWPQLLADILFVVTPRVLVVFRHDFGRGGRGAFVAIVSYDKEVGYACLIFLRVAFINNSKYIGIKRLM